MTRPLKRAAVIGAGPLGSEIAAALANAGIETLLLDRPAPPPERSSLAFEALDRMARADPPLFHVPEKARFIRVGNLEDDLGRLGACEWIIECAPDRLEVKREWLRSIEPARAADAVVSTSTERLRVAEIARGRSEAFRRHWLGTHFHTPVRYVRLLELVPTPQTLPEVVDTTAAWADRLLGKEIVPSHDTPFFIAKRIACFAALRALSLAEETSLDLELLDALTGPLLGFPKGGTSGLATRLGSETLTAAAEVVAGGFFTPRALDLGRLRGRSFGPEPASLAAGRAEADLARRVRLLIDSQDAAGSFVWPFLRDLLIYSAALVPVVSARYLDVDCAARRGLGWEAGPFELWQALGIEDIAGRIQADERALPGWV